MRSIALAWVLLATFAGCASHATDRGATHVAPDGDAAALATLDAVVDLVEREFVDPERLDDAWRAAVQRARDAFARGPVTPDEAADRVNEALATLGLSHTVFLTPDDPAFADLAEVYGVAARPGLAAQFPDGRASRDDVGLLGQVVDGGFLVRFVLDGSPAERAGLHAGDLVTHADGATVGPVSSFAGRAGTPVLLDVLRGPSRERTVFEVVPEHVVPSEACLRALRASERVEVRDGVRVGYVHVWSYAGLSNQQAVVDALEHGALADAEALVLDLRDGWGGADPAYLRAFGGRPPRLEFTGRDGAVTSIGDDADDAPAHSGDVLAGRPLVVLVDGRSRSGKEVLASGVRSQQLGTLVGERTAGAVAGGRGFVVPGGLLVLAVLEARVDGERLEGVGVPPDVEVARPLDGTGVDPQRERALALAAAAVHARRDD
ncbi:MAG: hypothetical protein H6825_08915 [Planctomycetes bacterium]|nr:hypothetical protein [Planctomycetota bacterium]